MQIAQYIARNQNTAFPHIGNAISSTRTCIKSYKHIRLFFCSELQSSPFIFYLHTHTHRNHGTILAIISQQDYIHSTEEGRPHASVSARRDPVPPSRPPIAFTKPSLHFSSPKSKFFSFIYYSNKIELRRPFNIHHGERYIRTTGEDKPYKNRRALLACMCPTHNSVPASYSAIYSASHKSQRVLVSVRVTRYNNITLFLPRFLCANT